jgi:DNA-binding MarR family transcriptional regulator
MAGVGGEVDLAPMLGLEAAELTAHLESLSDDGLIESVEPPHDLTPQGQFLINERFEDINF